MRPDIAQAIHDAAVFDDAPYSSLEANIVAAFLRFDEWVFDEDLHHSMFMLLVAEALS